MRKRSKHSRMRGKRTAYRGFSKKGRGKGSKGGKGMAGSGKMAGQKKVHLFVYAPDYLGKSGFISRKKKLNILNVGDIDKNLERLIKEGKAKKKADGEITLKGFKILGKGELKSKLTINADGFSKEAEEKIKKAGGIAKKQFKE